MEQAEIYQAVHPLYHIFAVRVSEGSRAIEAAVASRGAVPATIAVLGGAPTVGLDDASFERLARPGGGAVKC